MKRFNLLLDDWIPVKTHEGEHKTIKAYEISQNGIKSLESPRPDFNAAIMQFLIGLIQTVMPPKTPKEWRLFFSQPPSQDELKRKFEQIEIKNAFYLDGDGYLFMQDNLTKIIGKLRPIEEMVFGAPGESGKEKNVDHFLKQNRIDGLCYSCSAMALLAANFFAEDGGRGYYQSMRGNGFVSNLVQLDENMHEKTLWKNIWLNILEAKSNVEPSFYWIKDFPDKDSLSTTILPENNELQVYWAWMRRFLLNTENHKNGECSLCRKNDILVTSFYKTGKGYKYPKEYWQNYHPFSPSRRYIRKQYNKHNEIYKDKMLALEMTTNGFPYVYWHDFIVQNTNQTPAKVVSNYLKEKKADEHLAIWAFGYAMDSNSPLGWYESRAPLYFIEDAIQRQALEAEIEKYVRSSNKIADSSDGYLSLSIRMAWFGYDYEKEQEKKKNRKPDPFYNKAQKSLHSQPVEIGKCFWSDTEEKFYETIKILYENAHHFTDTKKIELRNEWYRHIKKVAEKIFDRWAFKSKIQTNPRRISMAYNKLMKNLNDNELKQNILGLPKEVN